MKALFSNSLTKALDEGEKFVGADGLEGLLRYNVTLNIGLTSSKVWPGFSLDTATISRLCAVVLILDLTPISVMYQMFNVT